MANTLAPLARRTMSMIRLGNGAQGAGEAEIKQLFEDVNKFLMQELLISHAYLDRNDEKQNFIKVIIGRGTQMTDDMIYKIKSKYAGSTLEMTDKGVQINVPLYIHQRRVARSMGPAIQFDMNPSSRLEIFELLMMICAVLWLLFVIVKELLY